MSTSIDNLPEIDQNDWKTRDQKAIWHPFTPLTDSHKIVPLTGAKGCYLHRTDGRKVLDAIGSWWVNLHGHSNEYIAEKIAQQARTLEHVIFAGFTHEPAVTLAERLLEILPQNISKIFYSDNGSTATEVGMKMAFQYWHNQGIQKRRIIAFEGAYHGDTFGAMSVGERNTFTTPFHPFLFEVEFIPFPENPKTYTKDLIEHTRVQEDVIHRFKTLAESGEIAAFIYEPLIQGSAGMRMCSPEILNQLLGIAKQHQILCIADEVMTGFGRTGKLFASDHCEIKPDIICLSKGLTGGTLPLGVTACTDEVQRPYHTKDLLKTFFHGHSFTANPLSCVAANASLDLLLSVSCQEAIIRIEQSHASFARHIASHPAVLDIRQTGIVLALEIRTNAKTSYFNEVRNSLYDYFLEHDILLRPMGNVIYLMTPYIITDEELQVIYQEIENLLNKMVENE
ncbi:adenosylmethionine--8-amino-7-oxononanoate transaminase [Cytophagaceae bacterium DM2B3-1]|uniref:Adenosylmethionine-8-amino-7-oxononanoate aminotransferase n=1 Tax=Xanthocytophaga flava TaxID=3048013 RepID=A0ABT7CDD4_9BACT|nr:adenosylmethionine--8-amino-7-oxononanoate transaminase [Xanthocytophaga flavus]MDJ1491734.1 adenosylmethionine--8-amino-7-oxononanoate transaminase [Xanthocytophaga flavus]